MIKKSVKIYVITCLIALLSYACCNEEFRIVGNGFMSVRDMNSNEIFTGEEVAVVTGKFEIGLSLETESTQAFYDLGLI